MFAKRSAIAVALALLPVLGACRDGLGPAPTLEEQAPNHVPWASPPQFAHFGGGAVPAGEDDVNHPDLTGFSTSSTGSMLHYVSFWAVRGSTRGVMIYYRLSSSDTWKPYERFVVPSDGLAARPDGTPFAAGDSVLITMAIDLSTMVTTYSPSGLKFNTANPPSLQKWYTGTSGDFNGDGVVNEQDAYIEANLLDIWTQSDGTPWQTTQAQHSLTERWFKTWPHHFSGYAVSW